jgi:hypothetical protein
MGKCSKGPKITPGSSFGEPQDVPESDYARLRTLTGCRAYLEAHLPQAKPST